MKSTLMTWLVSAVSLVAGMVCVTGVWSLVMPSDLVVASNQKQFNNLSGQQQDDLRNKATAFVDPANESELVRLQEIHEAVERDPALLQQLNSLDLLLTKLDSETKARLQPDGEFSDSWAQQIQELSQDESVTEEWFEFRLPHLFTVFGRVPDHRFRISGSAYESFLDRIAEGNWGVDEKCLASIKGSDVTMRRMFKTLRLIDRLIAEEVAPSMAQRVDSSRQQLVAEGLNDNPRLDREVERIREAMDRMNDSYTKSVDEREIAERRDSFSQFHGLMILQEGLRQLEKNYLRRYSQDAMNLEVFSQQLSRDEQMEVMAMSPADAAQFLDRRLVHEANAADPEIARVNKVVEEAQNKIRSKFALLRRGFGGRGKRGGGGRGPGGRNSDGRGPDGRGSGERTQNERGSGRDSERGSGRDTQRRSEDGSRTTGGLP